jgi:hypothetical protein
MHLIKKCDILTAVILKNTSLLGCYTLSTGKYLPASRMYDHPFHNTGNITSLEVFTLRSDDTQKTVVLRYEVAFQDRLVCLYSNVEMSKNSWLQYIHTQHREVSHLQATKALRDSTGIALLCF